MKLLFYGDDCSGATGYSVQARNILIRFHKEGFKVAQIGINRIDESPLRPFDDDRVPFKIFRANIDKDQNDMEGRGLLMKVFKKLEPDVLFVMGDIWFYRGWFLKWIESMQFRIKFKTIGYFSCEYPLNDEDSEILTVVDYPICHSRWGLGFENGAGYEFIKQKIPNLIYIPDSVDSKFFFPESEDQRETDRKSLGVGNGDFVITNVNRNTARKDIGSCISAFRRIKKEIKNAKLYLHTSPIDQYIPDGNPIDLIRKCELEGLSHGNDFDKDVVFPMNFTPHYGFPVDLLRRIYNCTDLFVSTSLTEGFGVTPLEALFCGRPVLIPGHTGFSNICETVGLEPVRYYPIKEDRVAQVPIHKIDEDDFVNRIVDVYENKDKPQFRIQLMEQVKKAVESFDSDRVFTKYWTPILNEIRNPKESIKAVLYVQRGSAGDVLLSTSVFDGLRERHPNTPIHYMTKPEYSDIVKGLVDEIIPWKPSEIHNYHYYYMPHEFKIWPGNWGSGDTTLTKIYSEILGVSFRRPRIIPDASVDGLPEEFIVVHACGGHPYRDYYNFHIALNNSRLPVIQIGGKTDQVLGNGNFKFYDLRGKLSYRQSAYVISRAKLFLGVDSYPMHVAGSFNVPMVVTFGCGAARVTGALSDGPRWFLEPVYSKICPIVGPCFGNYKDCPRPCGPRHAPQLVREAILKIIPDLFHETKKNILDVNKRLMELLDKPSRKQVEV